MVYQGTVWGPTFWNTFFADSAQVFTSLQFSDVCYADDLNGFKAFAASVSDDAIHGELRELQAELHSWGAANSVEFDAGKESFHILSRSRPCGDSFKILGLAFDCKLLMHQSVSDCVTACGWKMDSILRTRKFFTDREMVLFFKSHILSFIEYRTAGVYHASRSITGRLDSVLDRFLRQLSISPIDALVHFSLAPLSTRRDIAMLGVIHRALLGKGPPQLHKFFFRDFNAPMRVRYRHSNHTRDFCNGGNCPDYLVRSAFGLVAIYNLLPQYVVEACTVSAFQRHLQGIVTYLATTGFADWAACLNRSSLLTSVLTRINAFTVSSCSRLGSVRRLGR